MHLKLISSLVTLITAFIARSRSDLAGSGAVKDNQLHFQTSMTYMGLNLSKVKRDIRPHESALQPHDIERSIQPEQRDGTEDIIPPNSKDQSTNRDGQTSKSRSGDSRLPENRTSPTIYHRNYSPFVLTTQNPRSESNIDDPSLARSGRDHFERQNRRPASDGIPSHSTRENNDIENKQSKDSSGDRRLPENRTSRTIYSRNFPQFVPTTMNPRSETNVNDPPFVSLDEQVLDHFEQLLPGLVAMEPTDPMQQEKGNVVLPRNFSTNHSVRIANTTTVSNYVSKHMAELHDNTPQNDWYSRWMNFRIDRNSDTTSRASTVATIADNSAGNPRLLFLSGIGNFLALRALSKDNVNTTRLSNASTTAQ